MRFFTIVASAITLMAFNVMAAPTPKPQDGQIACFSYGQWSCIGGKASNPDIESEDTQVSGVDGGVESFADENTGGEK
jgi:hypothetical protein